MDQEDDDLFQSIKNPPTAGVLRPGEAEDWLKSHPAAGMGDDADFLANIRNPERPYVQLQAETARAQKENERRNAATEAPVLAANAVPFAGTAMKFMMGNVYQGSMERYRSGQATKEDIAAIADYEANQKFEADKGTGATILSQASHIPAILGEGAVAAPAVRGLGLAPALFRGSAAAGEVAVSQMPRALSTAMQLGARSVGGTVMQTAMMPSMWLPQSQERAIQNGGNWYDSKNLGPAGTIGIAQVAVLGAISRVPLAAATEYPATMGATGRSLIAEGVQGWVSRLAAGTATGMTGQQAIDLGSKAMGWSTSWGAVPDMLMGKEGGFKHFASQAVVFALFSGLHAHQGAKAGEAPRSQEAMNWVKTASEAYSKNFDGAEAEPAAERGAQIFSDAMKGELTRKTVDQMPDGPEKDLASEIVKNTPQPSKATISPPEATQTPTTPAEAPKAAPGTPQATAEGIDAVFGNLGKGFAEQAKAKANEYAKRILSGESQEAVLQGIKPNGATWNSVMESLAEMKGKANELTPSEAKDYSDTLDEMGYSKKNPAPESVTRLVRESLLAKRAKAAAPEAPKAAEGMPDALRGAIKDAMPEAKPVERFGKQMPNEMEAKVGDSLVSLTHNPDRNTLEIDFTEPGKTGGSGKDLVGIARALRSLLTGAKKTGVDIEYSAVDSARKAGARTSRADIYAEGLKKAGYELVEQPDPNSIKPTYRWRYAGKEAEFQKAPRAGQPIARPLVEDPFQADSLQGLLRNAPEPAAEPEGVSAIKARMRARTQTSEMVPQGQVVRPPSAKPVEDISAEPAPFDPLKAVEDHPDLNAREKDILTQRIGTEEGGKKTMQELADKHGVTRARIGQIEGEALAKMGTGEKSVEQWIHKNNKLKAIERQEARGELSPEEASVEKALVDPMDHIHNALVDPSPKNIKTMARVAKGLEAKAKAGDQDAIDSLQEIANVIDHFTQHPEQVPDTKEIANAFRKAAAIAQSVGINPASVRPRVIARIQAEESATGNPPEAPGVARAPAEGQPAPAESPPASSGEARGNVLTLEQEAANEVTRQKLAAKAEADAAKEEAKRSKLSVKSQIVYDAKKNLGVEAKDVHDTANQILEMDRASQRPAQEMLKDAREWLEKRDKNWRRKEDLNDIKGFDELADSMAREHPALFPGFDPDAYDSNSSNVTDILHEFLKNPPKLMSEKEAYQHAYDKLQYEKEANDAATEAARSGVSSPLAEEALRSGEEVGRNQSQADEGRAAPAPGEAAPGDAEDSDLTFNPADFDANFGEPVSAAERSGLPGGGQPGEGESGGMRARETALANVAVDAERAKRGLPPIMKQARMKNVAVWDRAMDMLDKDPRISERLVDELARKPRPINREEVALLLHRKVGIENEYERAILQLTKLYLDKAADPAEIGLIEAKQRQLLGMRDSFDKAVAPVKSQMGSAFQFLGQLANERYSLTSMVRQKAAAMGRSLEPEESVKVAEQAKKIADLEDQLSRWQKTQKPTDLPPEPPWWKKAWDWLTKPSEPTEPKPPTERVAEAKQKVDAAWQKFGKLAKGRLYSNPVDPEMIGAAVGLARAYAELGIAHVADFIAAARQQTGVMTPELQKVLEDAWDEAKRPEDAKPPSEFTQSGEKTESALARARQKWDSELAKDRYANLTWWEKGADFAARAKRMFVLSSPVVVAKLNAAAAARMLINYGEEAVGAGIQRIFPKFGQRVMTERGMSLEAEAKAVKYLYTDAMKDAADTLRTGKTDTDVKLGGPSADMPGEALMGFFGRLHGALKAPTKGSFLARGQVKAAQWAIENGLDPQDPIVAARLNTEAYKYALRSIFMQDNAVARGVEKFAKGLERPDPTTGRPSVLGKLGAAGTRFMLPVVKVPTNIVAETFTHIFGGITGSVELARAYARGIETLQPEQADSIMRQLKKGSLGGAMLALGYALPGAFGGFHQPNEKRGEGEPGVGEAKIGGVVIPRYWLHNPLLEVAQVGATLRRVGDSMTGPKGQKTARGTGWGVFRALTGLIEEAPLAKEDKDSARLFGPDADVQKFFGENVKAAIVPAGAAWAARNLDRPSISAPQTQREAKTVGQQLQSGIPFARQELPVKSVHSSTTPRKKAGSR